MSDLIVRCAKCPGWEGVGMAAGAAHRRDVHPETAGASVLAASAVEADIVKNRQAIAAAGGRMSGRRTSRTPMVGKAGAVGQRAVGPYDGPLPELRHGTTARAAAACAAGRFNGKPCSACARVA